VPALGLDDGKVLTEGAVILQYIADRKPASQLAPAAGTITSSSQIGPTFRPSWRASRHVPPRRLH
jgi:glutathione S-transferase